MANTPQFTQALDKLMSKFPRRYNVKNSHFLKGLLSAIAEGDAFIETTVEQVRNDLLVLTASGQNLDKLGALYGIVRDQATGISDDDFKNLIPILGNSPKQITYTLQRLIDVIYGPYATHANVTCASPEPYAITPGTSLNVAIDGSSMTITFTAQDANNIAQATAQELATAITAKSNGRIIGSVVANYRTGENFVNIRTSTIGSQGFVSVTGGDVQSSTRFPVVRSSLNTIATWTISRYQGTPEMIYQVSSGGGPQIQSAGVMTGDYVTIRSDSGFNPSNTGTFQITKIIDDNTFRVKNGQGVPESNITQVNADDFSFFNPTQGNILLAARPATILQTSNKEITVLLPVTSPIVKRTLAGGHHFHGGISIITNSTSNTATLASANGFPASGSFYIPSSRSISNGIISELTSNSITLISASGWPQRGAAYSSVYQTFYYYDGISGNTLQNVTPTPNSDAIGGPVSYVEKYQYSGISGNVLTGVFPNPVNAVNFEAVSNVVSEVGFPGSFIYDTSAPFIGSNKSTYITSTIEQGTSKTVLQVADISSWPTSGEFVLEFNTGVQEGPIKYFGGVGTEALIIDPSHVFKETHLKGTSVRLLDQIGPYKPRVDGSDYPVYLTSTSPARTALANYLAAIVASGITLNFQISLPNYKWTPALLVYADLPLDQSLAQVTVTA